MYKKLSICLLPVDDLLKEFYEKESLERTIQFMNDRPGNYPIDYLITLNLVTHSKIKHVARRYISKLLEDKEKYGYIYYLSGQKMLIPLDIHFQGMEILVDFTDKNDIHSEIEKMASEFACKNTLMYEITLMEFYYFFIRLINPYLTWLAIESMLTNVKGHAHLIMSPYRKHSYRLDESTEKKPVPCKIKNSFL